MEDKKCDAIFSLEYTRRELSRGQEWLRGRINDESASTLKAFFSSELRLAVSKFGEYVDSLEGDVFVNGHLFYEIARASFDKAEKEDTLFYGKGKWEDIIIKLIGFLLRLEG